MKQKFTFLKAIFSVLLLVLGTSSAYAGTVGGALDNVAQSFSNSPLLFTAFSYIAGIVMVTWSLFTFRDHVDGGGGAPPLSTAVKRMLAGGMFLALPTVITASVQTWINSGLGSVSYTRGAGGGGGGAASLDEAAVNFIADMATPITVVISAFAYLGGILLIIIAISRVTRSYNEGWRGPTGIGTIMTLLVGGALISSGDMMAAFSTSIFGDATSVTSPRLSGAINDALTPDARARVEASLTALLGFIIIVGWIAFIRGWFVLKAVADGNSQVSKAQALTFLFGGALAVNIGDVVNLISNTVGVDVLGITFS